MKIQPPRHNHISGQGRGPWKSLWVSRREKPGQEALKSMILNLEIGIRRHFSEYSLLERVLGREAVNILHKSIFRVLQGKKSAFPIGNLVRCVRHLSYSYRIHWHWPFSFTLTYNFYLFLSATTYLFNTLLVKLCFANSDVSSIALKFSVAHSTNLSTGKRKPEIVSSLTARQRGVKWWRQNF